MRDSFIIDNEKKNEYLENIIQTNEPATYELYKKLIYKLDEFENYKGISAMNMTKLDFMEFLTSLNSSNLSVLYTYKSAINSFLLFVKDVQKFTMAVLELDKITQNNLVECINSRIEEMQLITQKEYNELIQDERGNYQDKIVVVLLWNKIKGLKQYDEIINLKNNDVNKKSRTINIKGKVVQLSENEIEIVRKAMDEIIYVKTAVKKDKTILKTEVPLLLDGEYLVKSTAGTRNKGAKTNQCTYGTLANRLSMYFNTVLNRSELTGVKIYKSSIYYHMLLEYGRKLSSGEIIEYVNKNDLRIALSNIYREQEVMYNKLIEQGLI